MLIMAVNSFALAKMHLTVKGLPEALQKNVDARLSLIDPNRIDDTPYFKQSLEDEIKKGLRALGYYAPTFEYQISDDAKLITVIVNQGEPILIEKTNINISGEGAHDRDYISLLNNDLPAKGTILNHGDYDGFIKQLQRIALRKGYFDSDLSKHQLAVADKLHQAYWNIDFDTGQRYHFGNVSFNDTVIRKSYLKNIIPFKRNESYSADQLSLFNRRLSSTNWFSAVTVIPLLNQVDENKAIPLQVIAVPRKKNSVDVGIGYSSDNGVRGRLGWSKPWINDRGHSFHSELALSSPEQSISGAYKIPLYKSPLEDYYTIQGGYKKIDNKDTDSRSYSIGIIRNWDIFQGWQHAIGLNVMYDNFKQADDSFRTFLLYPSISLSRVRSEDNLFPLWADSQRYSLEAAAEDIGSDINFIRFQTQQVWIRSLLKQHRLVARGNFGIIQASSFERVPPNFRFFAGGDRSIRGYSYNSIAPKDKKGKLKGGTKLITGSLEYQYNLTGAWWGAVFVDTGEAIDKLDGTDFHTGAGIGIRWVSPIGPVKFDIATPIEHSKTTAHFYIGLGTEL
ncbi:outer membrane protein assembly factor [Frischella sp. Ac13]|uniref:Translocation and assembly module subunit TamA n=2 Tax=Orbaceae TaxID=1240483 RepID=A0ABR7QYH8_9GAMM|nr:outer membrane protein assembly factor [Frischella japonica]